MTPFSIVRGIFVAALLPLLWLAWTDRISWIWVILLSVAWLSILVVGASRIGWNFFLRSHNTGPEASRQIALSFDDGPAACTDEILEILRLEAVPATFFAIGKRAIADPETLRRLDTEGHLIGNHSFTHSFHFDWKTPAAMLSELEQTNDVISAATGKRPLLFRPPYGVTNPALAKAVKRAGMESVGWSLRSFDTTASDPGILTQRILRRVRGGDVILLHDSMAVTARALTAIIQGCRQKGFTFVRLDELLRLEPYA